MRITLRKIIEQKGWTEFRLNTRISTSDSYIFCDKVSYEDWEIQELLDKTVYDYSFSNNILTIYVQD